MTDDSRRKFLLALIGAAAGAAYIPPKLTVVKEAHALSEDDSGAGGKGGKGGSGKDGKGGNGGGPPFSRPGRGRAPSPPGRGAPGPPGRPF